MTRTKFFKVLRSTLCLFLCVAILVFGCFWKPLVADAAIPLVLPAVGLAALAGLILIGGVAIASDVDLGTAAGMVWDNLAESFQNQFYTAVAVGAVTYNYIKGYDQAVIPAETYAGIQDSIVSTFGAESVPGVNYTKENIYVPVANITGISQVFSTPGAFDVRDVLYSEKMIYFSNFMIEFEEYKSGPYIYFVPNLYLPDGSSFRYAKTASNAIWMRSDGKNQKIAPFATSKNGYPCFGLAGYAFLYGTTASYTDIGNGLGNGLSAEYYTASGVNLGYIEIRGGQAFLKSTGEILYPSITGAQSPANWLYKTIGSTTIPYGINPASAWPHPPIAIPAEGDVAIPVPKSIADAITLSPDLTIDTPADPGPGGPWDPNAPPDLPKLSLPAMIFTKKFPFSLPYDLYNALAGLAVPAEVPEFEFIFPLSHLGHGFKDIDLGFDLSRFETPAAISRWAFSVLFVIILIIISRKLMGAE